MWGEEAVAAAAVQGRRVGVRERDMRKCERDRQKCRQMLGTGVELWKNVGREERMGETGKVQGWTRTEGGCDIWQRLGE